METNKNGIVKFHNNISQARYKLNLSEQKLYIFAVQKIDQDKPDFETVEFTIRELATATGLNEKTLYREIDTMTSNIMTTLIKAELPGQKGWEKFQLSSYCKHITDTGHVQFKFHDLMKPFLLELKQHYFIQAPQVIQFKSIYAIKIYDFIEAMSYSKSEHEIKIDDFKVIMGCEGKYTTWNDLRKRVISLAVEEINEKTDLALSYELVRRGRKANSIKFEFTKHQVVNHKAKEDLIKIFLTPKQIETLRIDCGIESEDFTDVEVMELYELAVHKSENNPDYDVYEYMQANYRYMCEKLEGVATKSRRFGYYMKALENSYGIDLNQIKF